MVLLAGTATAKQTWYAAESLPSSARSSGGWRGDRGEDAQGDEERHTRLSGTRLAAASRTRKFEASGNAARPESEEFGRHKQASRSHSHRVLRRRLRKTVHQHDVDWVGPGTEVGADRWASGPVRRKWRRGQHSTRSLHSTFSSRRRPSAGAAGACDTHTLHLSFVLGVAAPRASRPAAAASTRSSRSRPSRPSRRSCRRYMRCPCGSDAVIGQRHGLGCGPRDGAMGREARQH